MNYTQKQLWKGAWKSGVGVVAGAVITNVTDPRDPIYSKAWFLHLGIASLTTLLFVEGRYWKQWADSGDENPLPDALDHAADANQEVKKAIDDAKAAIPGKP